LRLSEISCGSGSGSGSEARIACQQMSTRIVKGTGLEASGFGHFQAFGNKKNPPRGRVFLRSSRRIMVQFRLPPLRSRSRWRGRNQPSHVALTLASSAVCSPLALMVICVST
jgi:hypothetical protein